MTAPELLGLALALALPWAVGAAWLRLFAAPLTPGAVRRAWCAGYGFFVGVALTAVLLVLSQRYLGELKLAAVLSALTLALLLGLLLPRVVQRA